MNRKHRSLAGICLTALIAFAGWVPSAVADTMALAPPAGGPSNSNYAPNSPVNLGMVFTAGSAIDVTSLGFYAQGGTLPAGETVTLYSSTGSVLDSVFVANTGPITDGYYWQSISPVALAAGDTYTVSAFVGNNSWAYGGAPVVASSITYDGHEYKYGSSPAFPDQSAGAASDAYYGPSFLFSSVSTVPEPSSWLLLATGLLAAAFAGRRKLLA